MIFICGPLPHPDYGDGPLPPLRPWDLHGGVRPRAPLSLWTLAGRGRVAVAVAEAAAVPAGGGAVAPELPGAPRAVDW